MRKYALILTITLLVFASSGTAEAGKYPFPDFGHFFTVAVNQFADGQYLRQQNAYETYDGPISEVYGDLTAGVGMDALEIFMDDGVPLLIFSPKNHAFLPGEGLLRPGWIYAIDDDGNFVDGIDLGVTNVDAVSVPPIDDVILFSTAQNQMVPNGEAFTFLRHENVYAYSMIDGTYELVLDGVELGLRSLDAVDLPILQVFVRVESVLEDGSGEDMLPILPFLIFSVSQNQSLTTPCGSVYLRQENAYVIEPGGCVSLVFDGQDVPLYSLDGYAIGLDELCD